MYIDYKIKPEEKDLIYGSFQTIIDAVKQPEAPRTGVLSYFLSKSVDSDDNAYFYELFADLDSSLTHLTENEASAIEEMFEKKALKSEAGMAVGYSECSESLRAMVNFSVGCKEVHALNGVYLLIPPN